jgi:hypothetical protein
MRTIVKAVIGGVIVQVSIFLLLLLGVLINIDKLMPSIATVLVAVIMLTAPGILWLVREGEPQANQGLLLATGIIIDTILYSVVIYIILLLIKLAKKPSAPATTG